MSSDDRLSAISSSRCSRYFVSFCPSEAFAFCRDRQCSLSLSPFFFKESVERGHYFQSLMVDQRSSNSDATRNAHESFAALKFKALESTCALG